MIISDETYDWIEKTTEMMVRHVERPTYYVALEGLPCAGKTTTKQPKSE